MQVLCDGRWGLLLLLERACREGVGGGVRVGLEETKLGAGEGGGRGAILLQMDPVFVCIETN